MFQVWGWSAIWWCGRRTRCPCLASVCPPWCQGSSWWYSVQAGGRSQLCGGAAVVAVVDRDLLVAVEQPLLATHVERHRGAVEDHRDDPGLAGQPPGLGGGDPAPVSVSATPSPDISASKPMVTTRVNGDPFTLRQVGLRWFSTSSISPCPSRVACGSFFPVAGSSRPSPIRRGEVSASSAFFSRSRVQGGQLERALAGAVAVVADREVRQRPGLGLFLLQLRPSAASAASGQTTSNSRLPELSAASGRRTPGPGRPCAPRPPRGCRPGGRRTPRSTPPPPR